MLLQYCSVGYCIVSLVLDSMALPCCCNDCSMQAKKHRVCASQTSGNDIFYRNPYNVNENLFVDISSPSSSNFSSVEDLGPPEAAAKRTLDQVGCSRMSRFAPDSLPQKRFIPSNLAAILGSLPCGRKGFAAQHLMQALQSIGLSHMAAVQTHPLSLVRAAQYLEELMSTRLGVKRKGEVLSADRRTGPDGREYYDIQARLILLGCTARTRLSVRWWCSHTARWLRNMQGAGVRPDWTLRQCGCAGAGALVCFAQPAGGVPWRQAGQSRAGVGAQVKALAQAPALLAPSM